MPITPDQMPAYVPPIDFYAETERRIDSVIRSNWHARDRFSKFPLSELVKIQLKHKDKYTGFEFISLFDKIYGKVWNISNNHNMNLQDVLNNDVNLDKFVLTLTPKNG